MLVIKTILTIASILGLGYGILSFMAGSMSDNPQAGNDAASSGMALAGFSLLALIGCIIWAFH